MSQRQLVLVWDRGRDVANRVEKGNRRQQAYDRAHPQGAPPSSPGVSSASGIQPDQPLKGSWVDRYSGWFSLASLILVVVVLLFNIGTHFGVWNTQLGQVIRDIEAVEKDIGKMRGDVHELDELDVHELDVRLARIEGPQSQYYREQAVELGFKDPQIVPAHIAQSQTAQELGGKIPYHLTFRLKEITTDCVKFLLDGEINNIIFEQNILNIPYKVGVPFNLANPLRRFGIGVPPLWIAILDSDPRPAYVGHYGSRHRAEINPSFSREGAITLGELA